MNRLSRLFIALLPAVSAFRAMAGSPAVPDTIIPTVDTRSIFPVNTMHPLERPVESIYAFPSENTRLGFSHPDWRRMWINTGVLTGCYVAALFVLECLPEDATNWNRAEFHNTPFWVRWRDHVINEGPEWDHDNTMFNFLLHPYSGAAYFMAARSCGFSFWGSMLYSALISTFEWEFGIEACMERPSYQDIFITPLVGSAMGEGFFRIKRYLVANDYRLFGSPVLGNIVAFLVDPVNEVIGLFGGNPARRYAKSRKLEIASSPLLGSAGFGVSLSVRF